MRRGTESASELNRLRGVNAAFILSKPLSMDPKTEEPGGLIDDIGVLVALPGVQSIPSLRGMEEVSIELLLLLMMRLAGVEGVVPEPSTLSKPESSDLEGVTARSNGLSNVVLVGVHGVDKAKVGIWDSMSVGDMSSDSC